jgi:hypothetical protein
MVRSIHQEVEIVVNEGLIVLEPHKVFLLLLMMVLFLYVLVVYVVLLQKVFVRNLAFVDMLVFDGLNYLF